MKASATLTPQGFAHALCLEFAKQIKKHRLNIWVQISQNPKFNLLTVNFNNLKPFGTVMPCQTQQPIYLAMEEMVLEGFEIHFDNSKVYVRIEKGTELSEQNKRRLATIIVNQLTATSKAA